jgi:hypothetical protein
MSLLKGYYRRPVPAHGASLVFSTGLAGQHSFKAFRPTAWPAGGSGSGGSDSRQQQEQQQEQQLLGTLASQSASRGGCVFTRCLSAEDEEAISVTAWGLASLFSMLSLSNVCRLISAAMLECSIVFIGGPKVTLRMTSAAALALLPLIRPLEWHGIYLPVLPKKLHDLMDAPVPFIVGVTELTANSSSLQSEEAGQSEGMGLDSGAGGHSVVRHSLSFLSVCPQLTLSLLLTGESVA